MKIYLLEITRDEDFMDSSEPIRMCFKNKGIATKSYKNAMKTYADTDFAAVLCEIDIKEHEVDFEIEITREQDCLMGAKITIEHVNHKFIVR